MRKTYGLLTALAVSAAGTQAGEAQMANRIVNMPFIVGELSIMAQKCGLRDKIWAFRLLGQTQGAIHALDFAKVTPETGATEDSLLDRIHEGQKDAIATFASDPGACAKLTPDKLAKFDPIVAGTAPVF